MYYIASDRKEAVSFFTKQYNLRFTSRCFPSLFHKKELHMSEKFSSGTKNTKRKKSIKNLYLRYPGAYISMVRQFYCATIDSPTLSTCSDIHVINFPFNNLLLSFIFMTLCTFHYLRDRV